MLKKSLLEIKNKFKEKPVNFLIRYFFGFLFLIGVVLLSYYVGYKINKYSENLRSILPNLYRRVFFWLFNYALTLLFPLTILSSSISLIGVMFKEKSLSFLLRLPLRDFYFFYYIYLKAFFLSNSYIYIIFIPIIWGIGNFYSSVLFFIPLTFYLIFSFSISFILTILLSFLFKVSNLHKFFSFSLALFSITILIFFRLSFPQEYFASPYLFFISFKEPKAFIFKLFSPISNSFCNILLYKKIGFSSLFWIFPVLLSILSFIFFKIFYLKAYSKSYSSKEGKKGIRFSKIIFKSMTLNLILKEWLSITRTPLRLTQTALMVSLIFLYFFNFQLVPLKNEPIMVKLYKGLHIFLLSFILSALGLRFSYPSISLEGKSFNLFKAFPFQIKKIVFAKGLSYFLPFFFLSLILNLSAFYSINFSLNEKIFFTFYGIFFSLFSSFGGVLFGSIHPNFKNSNPLQIGFSAEGLSYFFFSLLLSLIFTVYYIRDFLRLFL